MIGHPRKSDMVHEKSVVCTLIVSQKIFWIRIKVHRFKQKTNNNESFSAFGDGNESGIISLKFNDHKRNFPRVRDS